MKLKKFLLGFLILLGVCILNTKPSLAKEVKTFLGNYTISAYSPESNTPVGSRETCTGAVATANRTIAVDMHNPIAKYGDILEIDGMRYKVEDCGNLEKYDRQLDIFMDTGSEANNWGVRSRDVYLIKEVDDNYFEISEETMQEMITAYQNYVENSHDEVYGNQDMGYREHFHMGE